jgi:hypothetical protein
MNNVVNPLYTDDDLYGSTNLIQSATDICISQFVNTAHTSIHIYHVCK